MHQRKLRQLRLQGQVRVFDLHLTHLDPGIRQGEAMVSQLP
jgi:hypothetical protein